MYGPHLLTFILSLLVVSIRCQNNPIIPPQQPLVSGQSQLHTTTPKLYQDHQIPLDEIIPSSDSAGQIKCCPTGTVYSNGVCVFESSSVCPPNTQLQAGMCVSSQQPSCPSGAAFANGACVSETVPICTVGANFDGQSCTSTQLPLCPPGFIFDGNSCITTEGLACPIGFNM